MAQSAFTVTRRDSLFWDYTVPFSQTASYDVSPDGKRFAMAVGGARSRESPVLVFGWLDEVRERLALAASK